MARPISPNAFARLCQLSLAERSPLMAAARLENVRPAAFTGNGAVHLVRITLDPIVPQQAVFTDFPHGGPGHLERRSVRRRAHHAVVSPGDPPARGDAAAVMILECLDDMELE